jgi:hypothetical protein
MPVLQILPNMKFGTHADQLASMYHTESKSDYLFSNRIIISQFKFPRPYKPWLKSDHNLDLPPSPVIVPVS